MYKIIELDGQKRVHTINGGVVKIGRDPAQCKINLPKTAPGVSRVHAFLELRGEDLVLVDQSAYGTVIGGEVITKGSRILRDKDEFLVGEFTFLVEGAPPKVKQSQASAGVKAKSKITNFFQAPTLRVSQLDFGNTIVDETQRSIIQRSGKSVTQSQNLRAKLLGGKTIDPNDSDDNDVVMANETPRRFQPQIQNETPVKNMHSQARTSSTSNSYATLSSFVNEDDDDDDIISTATSSKTTQRVGRTIGNVFSRAQMRAASLRKRQEEIGNANKSENPNHHVVPLSNKKAKTTQESKFTGDDAIVLPMDSGPVVSTTQAPTHNVRTLNEAFEAVSPKKAAVRSRRTSPATKKSRLENNVAEDADFKCPQPKEEPKRKAPKKADIQEVQKEFENLCAQMCSGKSVMSDEDSATQEQLQKIEDRERRDASLIHEKIDKIVHYQDLERSSQNSSIRSNYTASSSGLPSFKKFRKAQQGRFNESIYREVSETARKLPPPRIGANDLVDFRKIQPGESFE